MPFSGPPPNYPPPPGWDRRPMVAALQAASNDLLEAHRAIVQALAEESASGCSTLMVRALNQTQQAVRNIDRANSCTRLPPDLQHLAYGRRR